MRVLIIDNDDSYTGNLAELVGGLTGAKPRVVASRALAARDLVRRDFDCVIVSPGPGHPGHPRDVGASPLAFALLADVPVLGVCLGMQVLAHLYGARIGRAAFPRHGVTSRIRHDGDGLFAGVPQDFHAMRYHSLAIDPQSLGARLRACAWADDQTLMAISHHNRPHAGVQFHPESIATEHGAALIANFLRLAKARNAATPSPAPATPKKPKTSPKAAPRVLRPWPRFYDPRAVFAALYADAPYAFLLLGEKHSYVGAADTVLSATPAGSTLTTPNGGEALDMPIWQALESQLGASRHAGAFAEENPPSPVAALTSGLVGYFAYEAALTPPNLPRDTVIAEWMAPREVLIFDHAARRLWIDAPPRAAKTIAKKLRALDTVPKAGAEPTPEPTPETQPQAPPAGAKRLARRTPRAAYLDKIARARALICDGEAYELCLTDDLEGACAEDPFAVFCRLSAQNPAPYAAFLRFGARAMASASPECFLKVDRRGVAETRPIKGTRPRGRTPEEDAALARTLAASAKDRAENLMIVDVSRHDLTAVSALGSVETPRRLEVEAHPTVFQLVSTVRARLRPGASAVSAARALFPPASMTGAPKHRAVEHLRALEERPRGVYSGAFGYFDGAGGCNLAVTIRTLVFEGGRARCGVGGAILLASDAEEEWSETELKAKALRAALRELL